MTNSLWVLAVGAEDGIGVTLHSSATDALRTLRDNYDQHGELAAVADAALVDALEKTMNLTIAVEEVSTPSPCDDEEFPIFYELPARLLQPGMTTAEGQTILGVSSTVTEVVGELYTPRPDDPVQDARNRTRTESVLYRRDQAISLAVFPDTEIDMSAHPEATPVDRGRQRHSDASRADTTNDLDDDRCRDPFGEGCTALLSDNEGYDGACGNCADRLEAKGFWG